MELFPNVLTSHVVWLFNLIVFTTSFRRPCLFLFFDVLETLPSPFLLKFYLLSKSLAIILQYKTLLSDTFILELTSKQIVNWCAASTNTFIGHWAYFHLRAVIEIIVSFLNYTDVLRSRKSTIQKRINISFHLFSTESVLPNDPSSSSTF